MSRRLGGRDVPEAMFNEIKGVRARGGKVHICLPEGGGTGNCANCDGCGHLILQRVVGGPSDTPPSSGGANGSLTFMDGVWYLVKNELYNCPVCHGSGRTQEIARQREVAF